MKKNKQNGGKRRSTKLRKFNEKIYAKNGKI